MSSPRTSAAVLGACAIGMAMLLVPRPSSSASRNATAAQARATRAGMITMLAPEEQHRVAVVVALCADCAASHALVRVLHRRLQHGHALRTAAILVDRRWPLLDSLIRFDAGTRVHERAQLHALVHITPAAMATAGGDARPRSAAPLVIGVPAVADLLTSPPVPFPPSIPRAHAPRIP